MMRKSRQVFVNAHVYHSDFRYESRILRCTWSAVNAGGFDRAEIISRHSDKQLKYEKVDDSRAVHRLSTPRILNFLGKIGKILSLLMWQARVFFKLLRLRPVVINPHSVEVLPVCVFTAWILRSAVIYDTHELESQKSGAGNVYRKVTAIAERIFCPRCSMIVTVCDPITNWYRERFSTTQVATVRNFPLRSQGLHSPRTGLRRDLGIPIDRTLVIYQGAVGEGRGVSLILETFATNPTLPIELLVLGYGELVENVIRASANDPRIHYLPAVAPTEVLSVTSQADIALCLIEGVSLSYEYSLPNKLLEATIAGVPTIVSDLPEMRRFITERNCGWVCRPTIDDFGSLLTRLSIDEIRAKRGAALDASRDMDWEKEVEPVIKRYRELLNKDI